MSDSGTILIVDDELEVSMTLQEYLRRQGHDCLVVGTGAEALRTLETASVPLLVLDTRLPDMDGIDVMRHALTLADGPDVLVMTGHVTADAAMAAVEGSAVGFIVKPIDLPRLAGIVRRVLDRRRLTRQNALLQSEMDRRLQETEALLAISTITSSTLDLREALRQVCRELTRLIGADTGAAYLHDPASDRLVPQAGYRVPSEILPTLLATPLPLKDEGFRESVWTERRLVMSEDVATDPRFSHEMFRAFRHQSGLVLPLILDSRVAGAFYLVWWSARRRLTEREQSLMQGIAAQVSVLLRNTRLFEQAERERRRLAVLYEVGRRLAAAPDPEGLLAMLVEETTKLLEHGTAQHPVLVAQPPVLHRAGHHLVELGQAERLLEVIKGMQPERLDRGVDLGITGGDDHIGIVAVVPHGLEHFDAAAARHLEVHHHDVEAFAGEGGERRLAVRGRLDTVPLALEPDNQGIGKGWVVLDDKQAGRGDRALVYAAFSQHRAPSYWDGQSGPGGLQNTSDSIPPSPITAL